MPANPPRFFPAALSLAGGGAVLLATSQYGAGLSPDAVGYIGVARQLLAGHGVIGYDGQPFVIQPPLYPALLALLAWLAGCDPLAAAPVLNALLCGAVVLLTARLCTRHHPAFGALAPFGPALALLSWPLFAVGVMAWSEPLFMALELAALLCLCRYRDQRHPGWLVAAALGVALVCLTRYIGLAFLLAGVSLVWWRGVRPWGRRLLHLALFGALAALPLALWLARNHALSGTWLGPRHPSSHSLLENLGLALAGGAGLWVPEVFLVPRLLLAGVGAVGVLAGLWWLVHLWRAERGTLEVLSPVAVWAATYALFLVASSTTTAYDDINLRLLAPLHPPLVVLLLAGAAHLGGKGWPRAGRAGLVLLLVASLGGIGNALAAYVDQGAGAGTGADRYNTAQWRASETIRHLRQYPVAGPLYSNAPDALYILCGQKASLAPRRQDQQPWPSSGQLVWLDAVRRRYLLDPAQLQGRLRVVARFADGTRYEFLPEMKE